MNSKSLSIKVIIADETIPMTIQPKEEETIRKIAKNINEKYSLYKANYAVKDKARILAMVALQIGVQMSTEINNGHKEDLDQILSTIDNALSELI
jgi:cell division protein ZapA (FtsZ GTPase activity inhibitor)